jgi:hypothetical protein
MFPKLQEFPSNGLNKRVDIINQHSTDKRGKGKKEEIFPPAQEIAPPCPPVSPFNQHLLLFFNKWDFLYFDER